MIDHLELALRSTGTIVSGIRPDQWGLPTPCTGWDVRAECNHLVGGLRIFAAQLQGQPLDADHDTTDWLGVEPAAAYASAARADAAAWREPGATDTVFDLAFGQAPGQMALVVHLTEVLVHGLDLAVATGQEHLVDEGEAGFLHAMMSSMGTETFRVPGIFDAEVPAADDDPEHRRLLAYLGRDLVPVPR
jgi:uncharacterized protein (TIGR03086 family)